MDKKDAIECLMYMKQDVLANSSCDAALDAAIEALKSTVKQPKTNCDRIRQMTDEEFAEGANFMLCTKLDFDLPCSDCEKRYIVTAKTVKTMVFFCFITYDGAKRCFDTIESTNEYAGFQFIPETAVLLKPQ